MAYLQGVHRHENADKALYGARVRNTARRLLSRAKLAYASLNGIWKTDWPIGEEIMASARLLAHFALGISAALVAGTALAQTPPVPASPYAPTATLGAGYPGVGGPADAKLRVLALPGGKTLHVLPAT